MGVADESAGAQALFLGTGRQDKRQDGRFSSR